MSDVLECYLMLRKQLDHTLPSDRLPQLVLGGHGSVDDPDGSIVFRQLMDQLADHRFDSIRADVCIARLPPEDRILNALMTGARIALQLSYQEGFEVKVTEALQKSVPVIAYRTGGIPLQIQHGHGGYLVDVGDKESVVGYMRELCTDDKRWAEMSRQARQSVGEDFWTVAGMVNWLWLFNDLSDGLRQQQSHQPRRHPGYDSDAQLPSEYVSIESGYRWVRQEWKSWVEARAQP
jgi:glycosyltransferase involved in cell wall biosynthesis